MDNIALKHIIPSHCSGMVEVEFYYGAIHKENFLSQICRPITYFWGLLFLTAH